MRFGGDPLSEDGLEGGETLPQALTLNTYKPTLRNKPYYVAEYSLVDVLESTLIHACKILVCHARLDICLQPWPPSLLFSAFSNMKHPTHTPTNRSYGRYIHSPGYFQAILFTCTTSEMGVVLGYTQQH